MRKFFAVLVLALVPILAWGGGVINPGGSVGGGGSGTVTNTGGNLTLNALVLGAGGVDTKVSTGIISDGAAKITLGLNTATLGQIKLFGNTSGDATIQPAAVAGTSTVVTLPNASSTLPIFGQQITFTGPTAARSIALPDAAFTVARTDAANTFTGHQTIEGVTSTGATGTGKFVFDGTPTLTAPVHAAGTTGAPSLNLVPGTLETTSAAGDIEMDANAAYITSDAGNRGVVANWNVIRAHTTVTYANDTNPHPIFTTPTNGRITLETGTYMFEGQLAFSSMSATSGNLQVDILGAGTATTTGWLWRCIGSDGATQSPATGTTGVYSVTSSSGQGVTTAAANTNLDIYITGTFELSGAGTVIPTITQANASASVLTVGSYIQFHRIGATTVTSVGQFD